MSEAEGTYNACRNGVDFFEGAEKRSVVPYYHGHRIVQVALSGVSIHSTMNRVLLRALCQDSELVSHSKVSEMPERIMIDRDNACMYKPISMSHLRTYATTSLPFARSYCIR